MEFQFEHQEGRLSPVHVAIGTYSGWLVDATRRRVLEDQDDYNDNHETTDTQRQGRPPAPTDSDKTIPICRGTPFRSTIEG